MHRYATLHVHFHAASARNRRRAQWYQRSGVRDHTRGDEAAAGSGETAEKRGAKLIPTISRNSRKYRCPLGWRSAHIGFICTFRFTLLVARSTSALPSRRRASQFYRHVRSPRPLSSPLIEPPCRRCRPVPDSRTGV